MPERENYGQRQLMREWITRESREKLLRLVPLQVLNRARRVRDERRARERGR